MEFQKLYLKGTFLHKMRSTLIWCIYVYDIYNIDDYVVIEL